MAAFEISFLSNFSFKKWLPFKILFQFTFSVNYDCNLNLISIHLYCFNQKWLPFKIDFYILFHSEMARKYCSYNMQLSVEKTYTCKLYFMMYYLPCLETAGPSALGQQTFMIPIQTKLGLFNCPLPKGSRGYFSSLRPSFCTSILPAFCLAFCPEHNWKTI